MRKRIGTCLLAVLMLAALTIPAFAADAPKIVNVDESKCVTTVADADKGTLSVKVQGPQSGAQYLIYILNDAKGVPTESTIKYIDQNGTGVFVPYPKDQSGTYYIFVTSSTDTRFDSKNYVATVEYQSVGMLGDVDGNGAINVKDAQMALKFSSLRTDEARDAFIAHDSQVNMDVDLSGKINLKDAQLILRCSAQPDKTKRTPEFFAPYKVTK